MDFWSCVSEGKGFAFEEQVSTPDSFARSRNVLMGWEPKYHSSCYGNNIHFSTQQMGENHQGIGELGLPKIIRKQLLNNSIGDVFSSKDGGGGGARMLTPSMATPNAFSGKEEWSSNVSSSVVESNSRDSLLIDLKLGRFDDHRDVLNSKSKSYKSTNTSSAESFMPAKRIRSGKNSQNAFCQVHGCNKDLAGFKDYHKRHKVCEAHSKTAKVIVNGIEQRFCQQCSRFHVLGEFDDGKRSCRKRLAGHNERRRKPQLGIHSVRTGRLLQSYNGLAGSRLHGPILTAASFIFPDILPSGLLHPEEYGTNDWCKRIKVEDGMDFSPPSAIPITNRHVHSKTIFPPYNLEKQYPHFHENGAITSSGSILIDNSGRYSHDPSGPNYGSRSFFQDSSLGSEDLAVFDTASTVQGMSALSSTGCALSLLSSQSHNSSSHSSGIHMTQPLHTIGSNAHYSISRVSERLLGVSSQASMSGVSSKFPSSGMNAVEGNHLNPMLVSDGCSAINFRVTDGIFQRSEIENAKDHLSCDDGSTINLLELSSQLQRVEHQRQSIQGKPENDAFCCL